MKIDNEFTVSVPIERAWEVLTDLEGIAPCMPGARLTGVEGDVYSGKVRVKVGPVVSEYAGTVRFLEKDDAAHRAVIDAKGRDSRGAGNASAAITAHLRADGPRTVVSVDTDLKISGKVAQLGSGMIKEVSNKLLGQFVNCLEAKLTAEPAAPPPTQPTPATAPDSTPAPDLTPPPDPALSDLASDHTAAPAASAPDAAPATASTPAPGPGPSTASRPAPASASAPASGPASAFDGAPASDAAPTPEPAPVPDVTPTPTPTSDSASTLTSAAEPVVPDTEAEQGDRAEADERPVEEAPVSRAITPDVEPAPLDILGVAGGAVYKRLIPLVVGIVVVIVAVIVIWAVVS
ncbi:SRPBCC family protein [Nonomuraea sp. NPDC049269]|uniref:SRPBCC family protein n=1 Tax=Nonomuraea sp. NPDC049269 TaxID=3364349 RepID=UPI0037127BCC